jgi:hypothetical protein
MWLMYTWATCRAVKGCAKGRKCAYMENWPMTTKIALWWLDFAALRWSLDWQQSKTDVELVEAARDLVASHAMILPSDIHHMPEHNLWLNILVWDRQRGISPVDMCSERLSDPLCNWSEGPTTHVVELTCYALAKYEICSEWGHPLGKSLPGAYLVSSEQLAISYLPHCPDIQLPLFPTMRVHILT